MRRHITSMNISVLISMCLATPALGQQGLNDWLNTRLDELVASQLNQSSVTNQSETPSVSDATPVLVDRSSSSDLVGLSFNPQSLSHDSEGFQATSYSFTLTPYAILAAFAGANPNEATYYLSNQLWRQMSISIGAEDGQLDDSLSVTARSTIIGAKLKLWNKRDRKASDASVQELGGALTDAGVEFGRLKRRIEDFLLDRFGPPNPSDDDKANFFSELEDGATFQARLESLGAGDRKIIDEMILDAIAPFVRIKEVSDKVVDDLRGAPQLSLLYVAKVSSSRRDEHTLGLTFDLGINRYWDWTMNAALRLFEDTEASDEDVGGMVATEFSIHPPQNMFDNPLITFSVAARATFAENTKGVGQIQAKLVLPLAYGASLPISVTWANRTETGEDGDTTGRVGLAIDTSRLLAGSGIRRQ